MTKALVLVKDEVEIINQLHMEIVGYFESSLEKGLELGKILSAKKKSLKHGQWGIWVKRNLMFSQQSASAYMRAYKNKDDPKLKGAFNLTSALDAIGITDQNEHVPMIRGFIKHIEFFDTIDDLIRDVKTFDTKDPRIFLNIHIDPSNLHNIESEDIFNIKIGIEYVNIYRRFNIA